MMPGDTQERAADGGQEQAPATSQMDAPSAAQDLEDLRDEFGDTWHFYELSSGEITALSRADRLRPPVYAASAERMRAILSGKQPRAAGGSGG